MFTEVASDFAETESFIGTNYCGFYLRITSSFAFQNSQSSPKAKPKFNQLVTDNVSIYNKKIGKKINVQLKKGKYTVC